MQTACGVGNDHVIAACGGRLYGIENDSRRVCALARTDDGHTGAFCPDLQLFAGCSTEGIACSQHHLFALAGVVICQLCNAGGLAHAVHSNDQNDGRPAGKVHFSLRRHLLGNDVPQGICRFFAGLQALLAHPVPQLVHQTHGHFAAHIRKDELLFQIIVHFVVDDAAGEGVEDIAPETGAGLFQTRFHFFLFFFFVFLAKSEEPHSVLLSFSLIYIRKPAWRQPVPDRV